MPMSISRPGQLPELWALFAFTPPCSKLPPFLSVVAFHSSPVCGHFSASPPYGTLQSRGEADLATLLLKVQLPVRLRSVSVRPECTLGMPAEGELHVGQLGSHREHSSELLHQLLKKLRVFISHCWKLPLGGSLCVTPGLPCVWLSGPPRSEIALRKASGRPALGAFGADGTWVLRVHSEAPVLPLCPWEQGSCALYLRVPDACHTPGSPRFAKLTDPAGVLSPTAGWY